MSNTQYLHNLAVLLIYSSGLLHIFTVPISRATWHVFTDNRSHTQSETFTWQMHCTLTNVDKYTRHTQFIQFICSMAVTGGVPWLWLVQKKEEKWTFKVTDSNKCLRKLPFQPNWVELLSIITLLLVLHTKEQLLSNALSNFHFRPTERITRQEVWCDDKH